MSVIVRIKRRCLELPASAARVIITTTDLKKNNSRDLDYYK